MQSYKVELQPKQGSYSENEPRCHCRERKTVFPMDTKVFFSIVPSHLHRPHPFSSLAKTEDAGCGSAGLKSLLEGSVCFNQRELFIKQSSSK